MIDISQIVSSAANGAGASDANRRAAADAAAGGFGDALTRARESGKPQTQAPAAKDTGAAQDKAAANGNEQPDARPAQAHAGKPQQAAAAGKPRSAGDEDKDEDDTTAAAPTDAAAAAALALLLPAAAAAAPAAAPAGAAAGVGGVGDTGSSAALQAALGGASPAGPAATPDAQADARPAAATTLPDTLQVVTAEARPAQPSVADTLATIASQRAAMQGTAPAGMDGKAGGAAAAQAVAGAAFGAPQDSAGQSGNQRPDSGIGQHRADPLAAVAGTSEASPATATFAAAHSTARAGEAATAAASTDSAPALAATLAAQQTPSASAAAVAAANRPVVAPPLYDSQWPQALGQQMIRLSTQGQQSAELQLNPPDLGPLKVVLNVVNDQAQAQFVSPHQAVRAAVEAALPHLRTALSENGIQLGQASVGSDGFASQAGNGQQQQSPGNGRGHGGFGAGTLTAAEPVAAPAAATVRPARALGRGEIDTFA
ncbi:flagellar hook-length control protein FliK [Cupriavidus necator]|uniref:flagellar hook-length control protein FliK n=1 Tax=Cupriavidus necator TaxID=106590 RepID=UPI00339D9623